MTPSRGRPLRTFTPKSPRIPNFTQSRLWLASSSEDNGFASTPRRPRSRWVVTTSAPFKTARATSAIRVTPRTRAAKAPESWKRPDGSSSFDGSVILPGMPGARTVAVILASYDTPWLSGCRGSCSMHRHIPTETETDSQTGVLQRCRAPALCLGLPVGLPVGLPGAVPRAVTGIVELPGCARSRTEETQKARSGASSYASRSFSLPSCS